MNRRKILYVHHGKGLGGAPLSLLYLIQGLDKTKFEPVVAFLHDSDALSLYKEHGITVIGPLNTMDFSHTAIYWFGWRHLPMLLKSAWDTLRTIFFIAPKVLQLLRPDIVHLNTSSLIGWGIAAARKKIPVVWHIREPLAAGYLGLRRTIIKKIIARYATCIVPICHADGTPWHDSAKLCVVYNAVNPVQFMRGETASNHPPTILFLGGLAEQKGTLFLLQVFKAVLKKIPDAQLWIAGYFEKQSKPVGFVRRFSSGHRYAEKCRAMLRELQNSTKLLGPTTQVPQLLQAADLLVFPAAVDHFARPIIEAGFMGRASIASNFEHLRELIVDGQTGYLINYGDHATWTEKIIQLLADALLRQQLGNNAFTFCNARFSINKQVAAVQQLYAQCNGSST